MHIRVGGPGFKPRLGHTKDFLKMVPNAALLGTQQTRCRIWEVTLRRTGVPSKGEHCSQSLHVTETGVKRLPYGPFGSVNPVDQRLYTFTFMHVHILSIYNARNVLSTMQKYVVPAQLYFAATSNICVGLPLFSGHQSIKRPQSRSLRVAAQ